MEDRVKKADKNQDSESHDFFGASLVKAALGRSTKYQQLVDTGTDEEKEKKPPQVPSESQVKLDSSSSYAEDDHPGGVSEDKSADFRYQELDDEYGSRPVAIKSSSETSNRRPQARKESDNSIPVQTSDPIVGHEYGIRPLLDDDELEDDDRAGQHHGERDVNDNSTPSSSTVSPLAGSSPALSPTVDPFVSAPFRRKPSKKKRSTGSAPSRSHKPTPETSDIFSKAPFKPAFLSKSQHSTGSPLLDSNNASPDIDDPFGNAPFVRRTTPAPLNAGNAKHFVSSVMTTTSPVEQTIIHSNLTERASGDQKQNKDVRVVKPETTFIPYTSPVPLATTITKSDIFGSVPFPNVVSKPNRDDSKKYPKSSGYTSTPAKPKTKSQNYQPLSDDDSDHHLETAYLQQRQGQEASLIVNVHSDKEDEDFDDDDRELNSSTSSKHSKSKVKGRSSPRETVGFSNMSFNDDDDEGQSQHSMNQSVNSLQPSSIHHPAFSKEPKYAVAIASSEALKVNSTTSYDTFTWPRKHKKSMATNEPFSSKKKIDILSK